MKVLYEISVLGLGHKNNHARTGVFRVVENLARELCNRNGVEMVLCSNQQLSVLEDSLEYLETSNDLKHTPFSKPILLEKDKYVTEQYRLLSSNNNGNGLGVLKKLQYKIQLKYAWLQYQNMLKQPIPFLHPEDVRGADIFHSPFYPLPGNIYRAKFKTLFLTAYDLIPILFPQYCEAEVVQLIQRVLDSITPDTWVLCISHATRNDLLNHLGNKASPDRVIVTELAASNLFFKSTDKQHNQTIAKKYNIPDASYILSLCTLEPRKNINQVIKSFAQLVKQEKINDLNLVLAGTRGWNFDSIFEAIEVDPEIKKRVVVTGFVSDADLAPLYSEALMFVYPSFYEGFGLPPLEAMQCGVPVITSNTSSLPEVVGDAGIMIQPEDTDDLCNAMLSLYNDSNLRAQLSELSLSRSRNFSWRKCADKTVAAYKASQR